MQDIFLQLRMKTAYDTISFFSLLYRPIVTLQHNRCRNFSAAQESCFVQLKQFMVPYLFCYLHQHYWRLSKKAIGTICRDKCRNSNIDIMSIFMSMLMSMYTMSMCVYAHCLYFSNLCATLVSWTLCP